MAGRKRKWRFGGAVGIALGIIQRHYAKLRRRRFRGKFGRGFIGADLLNQQRPTKTFLLRGLLGLHPGFSRDSLDLK